jgi:hypothetical protein
MTDDPDKWAWKPDDVELTPADEQRVEELLEEAHYDVGEDDYGDWFSAP